jgi:hypothetical protein
MTCSFEYRANAEQQRDAAAATNLPMVKLRLLEAAERWDQLADEVERYELPLRPARRQDVFY